MAVRVFISYAQDSAAHIRLVRGFHAFLRAQDIDARLDLPDARQPRDWPIWMQEQLERAAYVLVVASPKYKLRAEAKERPGAGLGARWEARLIRELAYADPDGGLGRILPVLLPGRSRAEIPFWLGPYAHTHYQVSDFTAAGAAELLRYLRTGPGDPAGGCDPPGRHDPGAAPAPPEFAEPDGGPWRAVRDMRIGGDYVQGDKYGGDTIHRGGKHIHRYEQGGAGR